VALAQLTLMGGNLLVLDEPTNHLDISAREALEVVLNEYNGTILFVSHDRYFIDAVADTIWMVDSGSIEAFYGTYSEYAAFHEAKDRKPANDERRTTNDERRSGAKPEAQENGNGHTPTTAKGNRGSLASSLQPPASSNSSAPASSNSSAPASSKDDRRLRRKLVALEEEIAMLEAEMKQLAEELTSASAQADGKRVKLLEMQYSDVNDMISSRMKEWEQLAT
jgi:ATP-binding cassette subfamily F protein 3